MYETQAQDESFNKIFRINQDKTRNLSHIVNYFVSL